MVGLWPCRLVSHALAASLRVLIHDWQTMVAQLEHQLRIGRLSLQAMWFYCHPAASSLTLLADICSRTSLEQAPLRGAELLNLLQHWAVRSHEALGTLHFPLRICRLLSRPTPRDLTVFRIILHTGAAGGGSRGTRGAHASAKGSSCSLLPSACPLAV
jgi:hypothetical protein